MESDKPFGDKSQPFLAKPVAQPRVPLMAGQVIDGFRLEAHLHQGAMAQLWRVSAIDSPDPTPLIMKLPRAKGGADPSSIVGFEVEQLLLPALAGLHMPRFIAKGQLGGQPYVVMERITGPSLRPRVDAAPLPVKDVIDIGVRVATALHDLHRQHLVHLDVKPANIMFRPQVDGAGGEAVLIDFSVSHHDQLPDLQPEEFKLPAGSGPYASPEQAQSIRSDLRSDLFSLGVMLYHLLTGQFPFGEPDSLQALRERLYREPAAPRTLRPDCPAALQETILRCLEPQPAKRHQTGAQLAFELLNPDQVALTERALRRQRSGGVGVMRRWFSALGAEAAPHPVAAVQVARSPMVLVAVDVSVSEPAMLESLRVTAQRLLQAEPGARLTCITVLKTYRSAEDEALDKDSQAKQAQLMVELKHWARPMVLALKLPTDAPSGRVSFQVLQGADVALAIVDHARKNHVDHIVMGARSIGILRRYLGSVAIQVTAQADCSVTVARHIPPKR